MFSKASIPPLNSFLWFTDNFFATRCIYKWCLLVSQGYPFKDKRHSFFRHHSKLPLTLRFSNCSNRRQETVSMPQLSPPQSLSLGNSIPLKKKQSKNRERAAEALFFFLPSLPTTHRVFWGGERCRNIVLNNKTRPLVFEIQSMF